MNVRLLVLILTVVGVFLGGMYVLDDDPLPPLTQEQQAALAAYENAEALIEKDPAEAQAVITSSTTDALRKDPRIARRYYALMARAFERDNPEGAITMLDGYVDAMEPRLNPDEWDLLVTCYKRQGDDARAAAVAFVLAATRKGVKDPAQAAQDVRFILRNPIRLKK